MVLHCMISLQISHQWLRLLTNPQPLCVTYHKAVMSVYAVSCFLTEQRHFWNINSLIKIFWISCLHMEKYDLWSTINVQFYFSGFARNLRSRKPNKAQTKWENIKGVQYFPGFGSWLSAHEQDWCQISLKVFILSFFYFLIICTNFPFRLCLRQSTPPLIDYTPPPPRLMWE